MDHLARRAEDAELAAQIRLKADGVSLANRPRAQTPERRGRNLPGSSVWQTLARGKFKPHCIHGGERAGQPQSEDPAEIPHPFYPFSICSVWVMRDLLVGNWSAQHRVHPCGVPDHDGKKDRGGDGHNDQSRQARGRIPERQARVRIQ